MSALWTHRSTSGMLRRIGMTVTAGAVVAVGAATPGWASAVATPASGKSPATVVRYDVLANRGSAALNSAERYWTQDRLRRARPVDQVKPANQATRTGTATVAPRAAVKAGLAPATATVTATYDAPMPPTHGYVNVGVNSTVGRVFFKDGANNLYSCSASSVNSEGQDLLYTAAHCVYGGAGLVNDGSVPRTWYQDWVYIPGFYGSDGYIFAPYGVWVASSMGINTLWIESADQAYDWAAVTVAKHDSQSLVGLVGANGFTWNPPSAQLVHAYGYPAVAPFDGNSLRSCVGTSGRYGGNGSALDIVCDMNQGSSGGPWLVNVDLWGIGYLTGVNSRIWGGLMLTPYFTTSALDLYNAMRFS